MNPSPLQHPVSSVYWQPAVWRKPQRMLVFLVTSVVLLVNSFIYFCIASYFNSWRKEMLIDLCKPLYVTQILHTFHIYSSFSVQSISISNVEFNLIIYHKILIQILRKWLLSLLMVVTWHLHVSGCGLEQHCRVSTCYFSPCRLHKQTSEKIQRTELLFESLNKTIKDCARHVATGGADSYGSDALLAWTLTFLTSKTTAEKAIWQHASFPAVLLELPIPPRGLFTNFLLSGWKKIWGAVPIQCGRGAWLHPITGGE